LESFGGAVYGQPYLTPYHLDGAMAGSTLNLLEGIKEWEVTSPNSRRQWTIHQQNNQTVYLPPGFSHEVKSTSKRSIAYNAIWPCCEEDRLRLLCANRSFIQSGERFQSHTEGLTKDCAFYNIIPPQQKKKIPKARALIRTASILHAKEKKGSTRRYQDGRTRKKGRRSKFTKTKKK
jgi:hypothetical protein